MSQSTIELSMALGAVFWKGERDSQKTLAEAKRLLQKFNPNFLAKVFESAKELCESEAGLFFANESAIHRAAEANTKWTETLFEVHDDLRTFFGNQVPPDALRKLFSLIVTTEEWLRDNAVATLDDAMQHRVMSECPLHFIDQWKV